MEILGKTLEELEEILVNANYKKFNATQIYDWIYKKKELDFNNYSNIKKELREYLKDSFSINLPGIKVKEVSRDTTIKYLFELNDKEMVEGVLMHHDYGTSFCISSQVGCNMGCAFCASGLKKKNRDINASELVSMVLKASIDSNETIGHIVIMGTGEPLDNLDNVSKFIKIINSPYGLEIGIRHITLSTCGLVPKIKELENMNLGINLALSLHAPSDELRSKLMPINKAYPLKEVIDALKSYFNKTKRRITFEYLLLGGINDRKEDALKLADLINGMNAYVNLIPYNHVDEFSFVESSERNINEFYNILKMKGINVTLRKRMGSDINGACGQLRSKY